jgi:hypothetical protein
MAKKTEESPEPKMAKRQRSPNYPAVGLRNAVERAEKLYKADGKPGSNPDAALSHIGFSSQHGQAMAVMSALKKFGLLEDKGGRIVPTPLAIEVFEFPPDHPRHIAALKTMALKPAIYAELVESAREHSRLPSDVTLKPELVTDKGFNPKAVDSFLMDFRDSLEYAGLLSENTLQLSENGQHTAASTGPFDSIFGDETMATAKAQPQSPEKIGTVADAPSPPSRPLSLLIGFAENGRAIYAHVAFDVPLQKGFLTRLGAQLTAMETAAVPKEK